MDEMISCRFEVILDSFRRRFKESVPRGGSEFGRTEGDEIRESNNNSPAKRSGGVKAVDR
jgi:hypothetical protein